MISIIWWSAHPFLSCVWVKSSPKLIYLSVVDAFVLAPPPTMVSCIQISASRTLQCRNICLEKRKRVLCIQGVVQQNLAKRQFCRRNVHLCIYLESSSWPDKVQTQLTYISGATQASWVWITKVQWILVLSPWLRTQLHPHFLNMRTIGILVAISPAVFVFAAPVSELSCLPSWRGISVIARYLNSVVDRFVWSWGTPASFIMRQLTLLLTPWVSCALEMRLLKIVEFSGHQ